MSEHQTGSKKDERLNLRVDSRTKAMLVRAAAISGTPLTEFVVQVALERAAHVIGHPETTRVSNDEFFRVLDLVENPPAPTRYLTEAMQQFN